MISAGENVIELEDTLAPENCFRLRSGLRPNLRRICCGSSTAGSVDDGKSTLIGRLLYDSHNVYDDQHAAVTKSTRNGGASISRS